MGRQQSSLLWYVSSKACNGTSAVKSALGCQLCPPPPPLSDMSFVDYCLLFNCAALS